MKPNLHTKDDKMFHALHSVLHRQGYAQLEDLPANERIAGVERLSEELSYSIALITEISAIGFPMFDVLRADELELGLLCLELVVSLKKGENQSKTFTSKFLGRTFQVVSSLNPYGLQIVPTDI